MRTFRKIFCLVMALALLMSMSLTALAASYDASNFGELEAAFNDTSGEDVSVNVTADIVFGHDLNTNAGVTYAIGTQNGSTLYDAGFYGSGTVVIGTEDSNMDVSGSTQYGRGNIALDVWDDVSVTVYGDVTGGSGDPDAVDYDVPDDYSDGNDGVYAMGNASVTVYGDVTGGNSYGTYGYGGDGITAVENTSVTVNGNVTGGDTVADPDTPANYIPGRSGYGVIMNNSANVSVTGNVTGGNVNTEACRIGTGVDIEFQMSDGGSLTVGGDVTGGEGANGVKANSFMFINVPDDDSAIPSMTVGSYSGAEGWFPGDDISYVESLIVVTGSDGSAAPGTASAAPTIDEFWRNVIWMLRQAEPGSEVTVNVGRRTTMPAYVMDAIREYGVTLILQWNGGEDIVIREALPKDDAIRLYNLADLAG